MRSRSQNLKQKGLQRSVLVAVPCCWGRLLSSPPHTQTWDISAVPVTVTSFQVKPEMEKPSDGLEVPELCWRQEGQQGLRRAVTQQFVLCVETTSSNFTSRFLSPASSRGKADTV